MEKTDCFDFVRENLNVVRTCHLQRTLSTVAGSIRNRAHKWAAKTMRPVRFIGSMGTAGINQLGIQ
jgi:hypothetical protein